MSGPVSAADAGPQASGAARRSWVLPAGTFVAGCLLGGALAGVGALGGNGAESSSSSAAATAQADADVRGDGQEETGPRDAESGLYVRVPASCVQTADGATTLVEHVDRIVAAVADLEPEPLRRTVDEVQQVREQVQRVAEQCRDEAARRLQDAAGAEATPAS